MDVGQYVIVRARDAGVHAGYYVRHLGREVELRESVRLWRWEAEEGFTLSGVALSGVKITGSKISPEVPVIIILDACEIIPCTGAAVRSIRACAEHGVDA